MISQSPFTAVDRAVGHLQTFEMGITVVDTLQPEAKDMAPAYLKAHFGEQLAFHGCISTAGPVAHGTVQETIDNVRETLEVMMPGGGYAFSILSKTPSARAGGFLTLMRLLLDDTALPLDGKSPPHCKL